MGHGGGAEAEGWTGRWMRRDAVENRVGGTGWRCGGVEGWRGGGVEVWKGGGAERWRGRRAEVKAVRLSARCWSSPGGTGRRARNKPPPFWRSGCALFACG